MRYAIPDIHGCNKTFKTLLTTLSLTKEDTVYLLGDYVDRGPDSKGVIDTILKYQVDGYNFKPIMGNHEDLMLQYINNPIDPTNHQLWLRNGGDTTLESYPNGVIPQEHKDFLNRLPYFYRLHDYVLIHASLDWYGEDLYNPHHLIWSRSHQPPIGKSIEQTIIHGHTPDILATIKDTLNTNCISLDNGACFPGNNPEFGNLLAFNMDTKELTIQENIE